MNLGTRTAAGIAWNFGEQMGRRGVGIVVQLLLARLLVPEDYGLIAMISLFLTLGSSLMDSGITQALVRLPGAAQTDFDTAFYTNICLGAVAYVLLFLSAPWIALFYEEPRLTSLVRVSSLVVLINSLQTVQNAILSRGLNFRAMMRVSLPAGIVAGAFAIALAHAGLGVWALVFQSLLASLLTTFFLWRVQRWRPTLSFSCQSFWSLYGFGYKLFLSNMLDTAFLNVYFVVIAKLFSGPTAGLYFFAAKLKDLVITQLFRSIQSVTFPALASIQSDQERLKSAYRKIIAATSFIVFPSLLILAALAKPVFHSLLPSRWWDAAPYLQLMCLAALLYPIHAINLNILKVKGRTDLFLGLEVVKKVLIAAVLGVSVHFGVMGILWGQVIASVIAYFPNSYFSISLLGYPPREQIQDFLPSLLLAAVAGCMTYTLSELLAIHPILKLLLIGSFGVSAYLYLAYLFHLRALGIARDLLAANVDRRRFSRLLFKQRISG